MEIYLIAKLVFIFIISGLIIYMIAYELLENYLIKCLKESSYLKVMRFSKRLSAIVFLYVSVKGIYRISHVLFLLLTSRIPGRSEFFSLFLLGSVLVITICYRKAIWYYLTKDKQTVFADWYMQKFFALYEEKKPEAAYSYLQKASELKSDSVFIWSMMAMFNERYFDKSDLADKYLSKAREALKISDSTKDKAAFESATGEILLCRDQVDEGLTHLKNAYDFNPCDFNKEKYEHALKWASEEESETS